MIPVAIFNRKPFRSTVEGALMKHLKSKRGFHIIMQDCDSLQLLSLLKEAVYWCESHGCDFFLACSYHADIPTCFDANNVISTIELGIAQRADVLVYSAMIINSPIPTAYNNIYWIDKAYGIDCMIIYRSAYEHILSLSNQCSPEYEPTSFFQQNLWRKLFVASYMNLSGVDKETDYTPYIRSVQKQQELYKKNYIPIDIICENLCVPVYIINLPERKERLAHILDEFKGKTEFEVNVIPACKEECGALGLWKSIRKVVSIALQKEEDVIVICEDDHHFTADYSKEFLFTRIMEGYSLGADYLNGGCADFKDAFVITDHLFGMVTIRCTQFIIIYKDFYPTILEADFDENVLADVKLSELTERKMVMFPFISVQKDFGYSDVTMLFNQHDGYITTLFDHAKNRLENIKRLSEESSQ